MQCNCPAYSILISLFHYVHFALMQNEPKNQEGIEYDFWLAPKPRMSRRLHALYLASQERNSACATAIKQFLRCFLRTRRFRVFHNVLRSSVSGYLKSPALNSRKKSRPLQGLFEAGLSRQGLPCSRDNNVEFSKTFGALALFASFCRDGKKKKENNIKTKNTIT